MKDLKILKALGSLILSIPSCSEVGEERYHSQIKGPSQIKLKGPFQIKAWTSI
jgi:hypothetical protein